MRSLFTVHAGEYLVGSYVEKRLSQFELWLPSKDTGIDLLLTNRRKAKIVSLQVKFSKDFLASDMSSDLQQDLLSCGWWTLNREKIRLSTADFWIFVLFGFANRETQYVIFRPKELLRTHKAIHGQSKSYNMYLWVTKRGKCWETRGLSAADQTLLAKNRYISKKRDVTRCLNDWSSIRARLK